tara:strand:+ start:1561 stop:2241 length:681 start_codon:yes stop_codon:yes gene_type:complete
MISEFGFSHFRSAGRRMVLAGVLLVAACTTSPSLRLVTMDALKTTVQYTIGRLDKMWVAPSNAMIMINRKLGREEEQLIGLRNDTTMEGDNFMWLRTMGSQGFGTGRFQLESLLKDFGEVPTPFSSVSNKNLRNSEDSLGAYFWNEYRTGVNTICVLAFRRLSGGARVLPGRASNMEVLMRNCVQGTVDDALAPIRDGQIGFGVITMPSDRQGGNRMLSPLAAPRQ